MAYQILFTDLDGTLLNGRSALSEENRNAVAKALAAGKQVVICSGRSWRSLDYFERKLGLTQPGHYGVAFNGGVVYETATRRKLCERLMDNALGQELVAALKALGADILLYAEDELVAEYETPDLIYYTDLTRLPVRFVDDFSLIKSDIMKIIIRGRNSALTAVANQIAPMFAGRCHVFFSAEDLLEFAPEGTHKGRGIAFLADYLRIPLSEVIAVGDQANDTEMIQAAGLGVAVANAVPALKAAADTVLAESNDQNAVSRVIHEYLLK